jgi:hypothetical protein
MHHPAACARFLIAGLVVSASVATAISPARAAAPACSSDAFVVDGTPLTVEICAPSEGPVGAKLTLTERFTAKGQTPFERPLVIDVLAKAETSRTIDDVPLAKLGLAKTLHLTVVYRPGSARLEHALLIPGAIALK